MEKEAPKEYWNYRILASECNGYTIYQIYEVQYKNSKPISHTVNPSSPYSEDGIKDLKFDIKLMKQAFERPVLSRDKFPEEFNK